MNERSFSPTPLNKRSLSDEIVFQIKEMIADGRLQPNQKLPTEHELCLLRNTKKLWSSRFICKIASSALMGLTALGLVRRDKHNSYVTDAVEHPLQEFYLHLIMDNYDIAQLYEARLMLEGSVIRLACRRAAPEQIRRLEELTEQMQTDNIEAYVKADVEYHNEIMRAANNQVTYEMYQVIRFLLKKAQMQIAKNEQTRTTSCAQHRRIIEAVKERNEELASKLMTEHIRTMDQFRIQSEQETT